MKLSFKTSNHPPQINNLLVKIDFSKPFFGNMARRPQCRPKKGPPNTNPHLCLAGQLLRVMIVRLTLYKWPPLGLMLKPGPPLNTIQGESKVQYCSKSQYQRGTK